MDGIRPHSFATPPASRPARTEATQAPPAPEAPRPLRGSAAPAPPAPQFDLSGYREYARAHGLPEDQFLQDVQALLADQVPEVPVEDRAWGLLRLLQDYPVPPGRHIRGAVHADVLRGVVDFLRPPQNDVERKGMHITAYVSSFKDSETIEAHYRRANQPLGSYRQALEDYIDCAKRCGEGFRKPAGDLSAVRYGGVSAMQVLYQSLYLDPTLTPIFRDYLAWAGRSDYALTLARETSDWTPEQRGELAEAFRAVRGREDSTDEAWRCTRLALETRRPGESLADVALGIDEARSTGQSEIERLNKLYRGLVLPKIEPLVLRAATERAPGEAPAARVRSMLEGYFLTGSMDGLQALEGTLDREFAREAADPALRERLRDRLERSLESRRRQGVDPETALQRAVEDARILVPSTPEGPTEIAEEPGQVRIGDVTLDIRG